GRLGAALALGDAERALPELTELCARHPLDEPLHALRIRALRAVGSPAEALAAYETVRRDLSTRLGTDPGPALRSLHAELLTGTPAPLPGGPSAGPPEAPQSPPRPAPAAGPYPYPAGGQGRPVPAAGVSDGG
ncbi:hypothetical protein PL81_28535, partial [Streptomyces sp. RSD-27]